MPDYPDFYLHVERSPIQPTQYQELQVWNWEYRSVGSLATDHLDIAIPDDGYFYSIDTISVVTTAEGLMQLSAYYCNDYSTPSWVTLRMQRFQYWTEMVISKLGAFYLTYPQGFRILLENLSEKTIYWNCYVVGFRYQVV